MDSVPGMGTHWVNGVFISVLEDTKLSAQTKYFLENHLRKNPVSHSHLQEVLMPGTKFPIPLTLRSQGHPTSQHSILICPSFLASWWWASIPFGSTAHRSLICPQLTFTVELLRGRHSARCFRHVCKVRTEVVTSVSILLTVHWKKEATRSKSVWYTNTQNYGK